MDHPVHMIHKMEKRWRLQAVHDPFRPFPRVSCHFFVANRPPEESESWRRASEKQAVKSGRVWNGDLKVSSFSF